jgi:4-amino-4-deoxy-L-arabinose transferase-like glycosyltransferase
LFDATAAWLSAILLFGTELFWRFAVSGLSTMLVLLIFVGLLWCLFFLEREAREPKWSPRALFGLAALSGVIVGVGCLTRYAFGWFIFPLVIYLAIFAGPRRLVLCLVALLAFVVVVAPWVARNVWACGAPFGTATFAALESTLMYPESRLVRSLTPEFERIYLPMFWYKLFVNGKVIITTEGPRFCGSWVAAFALAGLLVNFRNPACQRLRYFVLLCAPFLVVVQAMGRTQLSEDSLELNTENLLVLLAPIVIVYGVSFFLTLLDQLALPFAWLRYVVMAGFGLLVSVPMLLVFLPPKPGAVAYPPYNPPLIQEIAGWMRADELIMSDIPWAVAWYGKRQSVLITRDAQNEFFAINDTQKPVRALYLTQQTMDSRFLTLWVGDKSWHAFILDYITQRAVPPWFPLRAAPGGLWPSQLFLTDWERWRRSE